MNSRVRATVFAAGALACAGLSAAVAGAGQNPGAAGLGALRTVVVTTEAVGHAETLGPRRVDASLAERRVPESFVPPDALGSPGEAVGRKLATSLPAGSYLTASVLKAKAASPGRWGPPEGTTPVEVVVTGGGALVSTRTGSGRRVDVIVSGDSAPGPGAGRTYVAASSVPLLGLREARAQTGIESESWVATLAVTRGQALSLIRAESAGAQVRLLAVRSPAGNPRDQARAQSGA